MYEYENENEYEYARVWGIDRILEHAPTYCSPLCAPLLLTVTPTAAHTPANPAPNQLLTPLPLLPLEDSTHRARLLCYATPSTLPCSTV